MTSPSPYPRLDGAETMYVFPDWWIKLPKAYTILHMMTYEEGSYPYSKGVVAGLRESLALWDQWAMAQGVPSVFG